MEIAYSVAYNQASFHNTRRLKEKKGEKKGIVLGIMKFYLF